MPVTRNYTDPVSYTTQGKFTLPSLPMKPVLTVMGVRNTYLAPKILPGRQLIDNIPNKGTNPSKPVSLSMEYSVIHIIATKLTTYPPVYRTSLGNTPKEPLTDEVINTPRQFPPIAGSKK